MHNMHTCIRISTYLHPCYIIPSVRSCISIAGVNTHIETENYNHSRPDEISVVLNFQVNSFEVQ